MDTSAIFILGVGHNTSVYIDLAESCGYRVAGLYHYNKERIGESIHGFQIIDSTQALFAKETLAGMNFALSMGDNKIRTTLAHTIRGKGGNLPTLIHPTAVVSKFSEIESGVVINANSTIQANVRIRNDSMISSNVSVAHNSSIGEGCLIASHAIIGAHVSISDNVLIGLGAIIVSGKVDSIGANSIVGAGSVVTKSVGPNSVVVGNPAKPRASSV